MARMSSMSGLRSESIGDGWVRFLANDERGVIAWNDYEWPMRPGPKPDSMIHFYDTSNGIQAVERSVKL